MKQEILKQGICMIIMIAFLLLSIYTTDVLISHIYAVISIVVGAFAYNLPNNETNVDYE